MSNPKKRKSAATKWFAERGWKPQRFQEQTWEAYAQGLNGLVNAPTGFGKTYSILLPAILEAAAKPAPEQTGLQIIWITPIRALAQEIRISAERALEGLGIPWKVGIRSGDTSVQERGRQKTDSPQILITTPESLHLLLASKEYPVFFRNLDCIVVDEWHELLGTKRGVLMELGLSRLRAMRNGLRVWGISATIGNLEEARDVLLGVYPQKSILIQSELKKEIEIHTFLPDDILSFPWGGHLGMHLLPRVLEVIHTFSTTLIFANTRAQAEIWYHRILTSNPDLAGLIALHHGSLSQEVRLWVEEQLHIGKLKAVVCTSSLDLGVDFRPVEAIVQIGSPKGVARFIQRAGRSGHEPGKVSRIHFLPTHSLEIMEGAALRRSIRKGVLEARLPYIRSFDVLIQYLVTLAVSDGFRASEVLAEIRNTYAYSGITDEEFDWVLRFIVTGGESLHGYDEYHKVVLHAGLFKVEDRKIAMRHRLNIGTIVSDAHIWIQYVGGKRLGTIEEYFISRLKPGDIFVFAGVTLEFIRLKDMTAQVRKSRAKSGLIPSWQGGKMPLSSQLSEMIRDELQTVCGEMSGDPELEALRPLFLRQAELSAVPDRNQFLIEKVITSDGCHVFFYPFEGRFVHEGLAALIAFRLSLFKPLSFSIAMNDYGFELLSDQDIPIEQGIDSDIFSPVHLFEDIRQSVNDTEMARRKFREIARVSGLVFQGFPGKGKADRHLQASSQLFFDVFRDQEPNNLLFRQAFEEVYDFQLEQTRLRNALNRIHAQEIKMQYPKEPTPFSYPIMVERIRESYSNEALEERIRKMQVKYSG